MPTDFNFSLATPGLLFPAITLLLLAYSNRFTQVSAVIRNLHAVYKDKGDPKLALQIASLRLRAGYIRNMQYAGVLSVFGCVVSMGLAYLGLVGSAQFVFGVSLVLLLVSLAYSMVEIHLSVRALDLHLSDLEEFDRRRDPTD